MFSEENRIEENVLLELAYNDYKATEAITTKVPNNFGWHVDPSQTSK